MLYGDRSLEDVVISSSEECVCDSSGFVGAWSSAMLILLWFKFGTILVLLCYFFVTSLVPLWCKTTLVQCWYFFGTSLVLLWYFFGTSLVILWCNITLVQF